jgi:hypothetical protein
MATDNRTAGKSMLPKLTLTTSSLRFPLGSISANADHSVIVPLGGPTGSADSPADPSVGIDCTKFAKERPMTLGHSISPVGFAAEVVLPGKK